MHRFTQNTSSASAWPRSRTRRSTDLAYVVEYGLLAMLVICFVSFGATFVGNKLNGVFLTVTTAMAQSDQPQNVLMFGQRTNRKGAPIEREVSGKLSAINSTPLFEDPLLASKGP